MSTEDKRYNGYTNYETWCVSLWLDNDQDAQEYWNEIAQEAYDELKGRSQYDNVLTREEQAAYNLAQKLKDAITGGVPADLDGMFLDLLNAALSEVNWDEIATNYIAEVNKASEEEEATEEA